MTRYLLHLQKTKCFSFHLFWIWTDQMICYNSQYFLQILRDAGQLLTFGFIAKVRLSWNNLCTAWRCSRESHESLRLISLPGRRRPTSKSLQLDAPHDCDLGQVKEMSCRVAHYFQQQGYKKGEVSREKSGCFQCFNVQVVALVMENRVDYCCYWIGESLTTT